MKLSTVKFCFVDGFKNLTRNLTTTIGSSIAVSISIILFAVFSLYSLPFVIEGLFIGIIGSAAGSLIVAFLYKYILNTA